MFVVVGVIVVVVGVIVVVVVVVIVVGAIVVMVVGVIVVTRGFRGPFRGYSSSENIGSSPRSSRIAWAMLPPFESRSPIWVASS